MENPIKMDDLGENPLFSETPKLIFRPETWIKMCFENSRNIKFYRCPATGEIFFLGPLAPSDSRPPQSNWWAAARTAGPGHRKKPTTKTVAGWKLFWVSTNKKTSKTSKQKVVARWWFQPLWKRCSSKWESSPNRGENKKYWKAPARLPFSDTSFHLKPALPSTAAQVHFWKTMETSLYVDSRIQCETPPWPDFFVVFSSSCVYPGNHAVWGQRPA